MSRTTRFITPVLALALATSACGAFSSDDADSGAGEGKNQAAKNVTVITHDSFAMDKSVIADFEKQSGYDVKLVKAGDAGALTNKLILTKDDPLGDAVYGIDNTFASRAVEGKILAEHTPKTLPTGADEFVPSGAAAKELTPVDFGDVCVNVDDAWFAAKKLNPPKTLDDLTKPAYKNLFVTPGATTSSPGLAFLLATIAAKGPSTDDQAGWQKYWTALLANGAKIDAGWSDAYEVDFTGGGGDGTRPIVLSYASSPPFTIPKGGTTPTTSALLDTCFRQVEYAGVLRGAANPKGAAAFVDFMLSREFQEQLPEQMYVFPVDRSAPLPTDWAKYAKVASTPYTVSPDEIAANRTTWLREWRDLTSR